MKTEAAAGDAATTGGNANACLSTRKITVLNDKPLDAFCGEQVALRAFAGQGDAPHHNCLGLPHREDFSATGRMKFCSTGNALDRHILLDRERARFECAWPKLNHAAVFTCCIDGGLQRLGLVARTGLQNRSTRKVRQQWKGERRKQQAAAVWHCSRLPMARLTR